MHPCFYGESRHPHLIRGPPDLSDCSPWSALGAAPYTSPLSGPTPFCSSSAWTEESMEGQAWVPHYPNTVLPPGVTWLQSPVPNKRGHPTFFQRPMLCYLDIFPLVILKPWHVGCLWTQTTLRTPQKQNPLQMIPGHSQTFYDFSPIHILVLLSNGGKRDIYICISQEPAMLYLL